MRACSVMDRPSLSSALNPGHFQCLTFTPHVSIYYFIINSHPDPNSRRREAKKWRSTLLLCETGTRVIRVQGKHPHSHTNTLSGGPQVALADSQINFSLLVSQLLKWTLWQSFQPVVPLLLACWRPLKLSHGSNLSIRSAQCACRLQEFRVTSWW